MKPHVVFFSILAIIVAAAAATVPGGNSGGEPIQVIKAPKSVDSNKVELGKKLFFDTRLSKSGFISCHSCHNLALGGADNLKTAVGDHWQQGPINTPTVLNARVNVKQFWDGRAKNLQAQAGGPIENPVEMAATHELAVETLQTIPGYVAEFQKAFGTDAITIETVTEAIAAFEETLVTPNSRFDQWLNGDVNALSADEMAGYALFKEKGCINCHNGPAVGGGAFAKFGIAEPYKTDNAAAGRYAVTGKDEHRLSFKVPILRNIELTYPYFHDGEVNTLAKAVDTMARLQLGKKLTDDEIGKIVAFLKTLTGELPKTALPALPPSSENTPRPRPFD